MAQFDSNIDLQADEIEIEEDEDEEGEDWYNRPETFPDYSRVRSMFAEGCIAGDEWVSVGMAMPEFGEYASPEEALRQRFAFDVAVRAVAIDRERAARAAEAGADVPPAEEEV